ncbi:unnamed protein product [Lasius platythorax]|uniref:Uncharacterized protein n=1 Tax=Lasius platythorax TaxID=488582 RepID=A0AAV2NPP9_9HYME
MEKLPRIKPPGQPPKIWKSIEKVSKDGKTIKFTIQEIPEDRHEDAVQHMCAYFLADEPICQCLNAKDDPAFVQDMSTIWRLLLVEGISIAAFTDNPNGGKPIIAGMNVLGLGFRDQNNIISKHQTILSISISKKIHMSLSASPSHIPGKGSPSLAANEDDMKNKTQASCPQQETKQYIVLLLMV